MLDSNKSTNFNKKSHFKTIVHVSYDFTIWYAHCIVWFTSTYDTLIQYKTFYTRYVSRIVRYWQLWSAHSPESRRLTLRTSPMPISASPKSLIPNLPKLITFPKSVYNRFFTLITQMASRVAANFPLEQIQFYWKGVCAWSPHKCLTFPETLSHWKYFCTS